MRPTFILLAVLIVTSCGETPVPMIDGSSGEAPPPRVHERPVDEPPAIRELLSDVVYPVEAGQITEEAADTLFRQALAGGLGYVALAHREGGGAPGDPQVLIVRASPDPVASPVASFSLEDTAGGTVQDGLRTREPGLRGEPSRVGSEEYGLVVDEVQGEWIRVIYGYAEDGDPRRGWVAAEASGVRYVSYEEQLLERLVWFEDSESTSFYAARGGAPVDFDLFIQAGPEAEAGSVPDYSVRVREVVDGWARVGVTVPDVSTCTGDPWADVLREAELWVPLRDAAGRRQFAYAAAGC